MNVQRAQKIIKYATAHCTKAAYGIKDLIKDWNYIENDVGSNPQKLGGRQ